MSVVYNIVKEETPLASISYLHADTLQIGVHSQWSTVLWVTCKPCLWGQGRRLVSFLGRLACEGLWHNSRETLDASLAILFYRKAVNNLEVLSQTWPHFVSQWWPKWYRTYISILLPQVRQLETRNSVTSPDHTATKRGSGVRRKADLIPSLKVFAISLAHEFFN